MPFQKCQRIARGGVASEGVASRGVGGHALTAERLRHPDLATAFDRRFVVARRDRMRRLVRRAVERGDLPATTEVDVMADAGPALFLHRLVHGGGRRMVGLADRIVDQLLGPEPTATEPVG